METTKMEKPKCRKNQHMTIKIGGCGAVSVVVWGGALAIAALVSVSAMKLRKRKSAADTHPPPAPTALSDETELMTKPPPAPTVLSNETELMANTEEGDEGLRAIIPCDEESDAGVTQIDSPPLVSTGSLMLENKDLIHGNEEVVVLSGDSKPKNTSLWVENDAKAKEEVSEDPVKAEEATHAGQIAAEEKVDSMAVEANQSSEEEDDDENSVDDEEEGMVEEKTEESSEGTGESSNAEAIWPEESMQGLSLDLGAAKMDDQKLTEKTEGLMQGVSLKLEGVKMDEQKLLEKIEESMLRLSMELVAARMDDQKVKGISQEFGAVKIDDQKLTEKTEEDENVKMEEHGCPNTNEKSSHDVHHINEKNGPVELPDIRVWIWSLLLLSLVVPLLLSLAYNFYFFEMLP